MHKNKNVSLTILIALCSVIFAYSFMSLLMNALMTNVDAYMVEVSPVYEVIAVDPPVKEYVAPVVTEPVVIEEIKPVITEEEFELICRLVAAEARGETYEGQMAVAQVVKDRMEHPNTKLYGGPTASGVIYKKSQFAKPWTGDLTKYSKVVQAVEAVFYEEERVFTEPTLYFFHTRIANKTVVADLRTYNYVGTIGVHEFRGCNK